MQVPQTSVHTRTTIRDAETINVEGTIIYSAKHFYFILLFYLRSTETERREEIFHPLEPELDEAKWKPRAWDSIWVTLVGGKDGSAGLSPSAQGNTLAGGQKE